MTFPTSNLVARYEPWRWGYSDGDVIDTGAKKFADDSGNARHLNATVEGSPLYKTGGLKGLAYVRFSGVVQAVHGSYVADHDGGTIAAVIVPRALPLTAPAPFGFNDAATQNGPLIYYDGTNWVGYSNGSPTASNSAVPVVDTPTLLWIDSAAASGIVLRVDRAAAGNRGAYLDYTPTRFSVGSSGLATYLQCDVYAVFRYSARLTGSDLTDLEAYLFNTYLASYVLTAAAGSFTLTGAEAFETVVLEAIGAGQGGGAGSFGGFGRANVPAEPSRPKMRPDPAFRLMHPEPPRRSLPPRPAPAPPSVQPPARNAPVPTGVQPLVPMRVTRVPLRLVSPRKP